MSVETFPHEMVEVTQKTKTPAAEVNRPHGGSVKP